MYGKAVPYIPSDMRQLAGAIGDACGKAEERIQRILKNLTERYREVLTCRFLLNLSVRETAVKMGLTESNVKVLQFRALKIAADLEQVVAEAVECGVKG